MIDRGKEEKIELMVKQGKTIVQICKELDLEWKDVAKFLHSVDMKSWNGAKQVITRRLNRLKTEKDESAREKLAEEAAKWIAYLHADGKRLSRQVDRARQAMDRASKALDG
jgi:thiamine pyrophosphate-dependent acetolactate synthase large subunit-like protein